MPSLFFLSLMNGAAWGGSEELWYRTALYAAAKGYKIGCAFYDWKEKEEKVKALEKAGCRVFLLPNKGRSKKTFAERLRYKISKRQARNMVALLPFSEYELTVVNLGGFEIYTSTWKNAFVHLPKFVLLFHNYDETAVFKPVQIKRLQQWTSHAATNLFAAGRIRETLEEKLAFTISHQALFINPITFSPPEAPTPYPPLQEPFILVTLAELDANRKAQDNLIKALSGAKWKARPWQLRLYGKGRDEEMLRRLVRQLGLEEKVTLMGFATGVKAVLQEAHLVLQLTHRDAMPLAVVEAMAMARPMVVSQVGDMPLWVNDGHNGWVAPNASPEAIDAVMEKAWQAKAQWPLAGERSYAIFREKFPAAPEERFLQQLLQPA